MANNSDYKKPRFNIFELLPSVYQSDANQSIFENTVNRYLSKTDLTRILGTVGERNLLSSINRQIQEETPHRQAFQLQPLVYKRVATIDHINSWKDILNELERLKVDRNRLPLWGNAVSFNWAPPIDLDKLVNFSQYFWVNSEIQPQYITIRNPCSASTARTASVANGIDASGGFFHTIVDVKLGINAFTVGNDITPALLQDRKIDVTGSTGNDGTYTIVSFSYDNGDNTTDIVVLETIPDSTIDGQIDLTPMLDEFIYQQNCDCTGDFGWDVAEWDDNVLGGYQVVNIGGGTGAGHAYVAEVTTVTAVADVAGSLDGTYFELNSPTTNYYVWIEVNASGNDPAPAGRTGIQVPIASGVNANTVAAAVQLAVNAVADFSASLLGTVVTITNVNPGDVADPVDGTAPTGFTFNVITQGDGIVATTGTGLANDATVYSAVVKISGVDNNVSITGSTAQTYAQLIVQINLQLTGATAWFGSIDDATPPIGDRLPEDFDLTTGQFFTNIGAYKDNILIINNATGEFDTLAIVDTDLFSSLSKFIELLAAQAPGTGGWDGDSDCLATLLAQNDWQQENFWIHRSALETLSNASRATMPIIEYGDGVVLNEWTFTPQRWAYRASLSDDFEEVTTEPTLTEATARYSVTEIDGINEVFTVPGDQTSVFTPGMQFTLEGIDCFNDYYTVVSSALVSGNTEITVTSLLLQCPAKILVPFLGIGVINPVAEQFIVGGDATAVFIPGYVFDVTGTDFDGNYKTLTGIFDGTNTTITVDPTGSTKSLDIPSTATIVPLVETSLGDPWLGFFNHWVYLGEGDTVAVDAQTLNTAVATNEVVNIVTVGDVGGSLNSTYFLLDSPTTDYYVWFNVSGGGVDPGPIVGRTGVSVALVTDDDSNAVASAVSTAINALAQFSTTVSANTVTVTAATVGHTTDATDGAAPTGFEFNVTTQGNGVSETIIVNNPNFELQDPNPFVGDNAITVIAAPFITGDEVIFSTTGNLPFGLSTSVPVYTRTISPTEFQLHPTRNDAINNTNKIIPVGAPIGTLSMRLTGREIALTTETFLAGTSTIRVLVDSDLATGTYAEGSLDPDNLENIIPYADNHVVTPPENAFVFFDPLPEFATVVVEVNAAALSDAGWEAVEVRTSTTTLTTATRSLIRYRHVGQPKLDPIQYPLFDLFHLDGTTAFETSSIFKFVEDPDSDPDSRLNGLRILITDGGTEFYFEQELIDEDNGPMLAYKDLNSIDAENLEGLQTIWRTGRDENGDLIEYVPSYVDENRFANGDIFNNPETGLPEVISLPVGDPDGDWEVADQLFFNPNHENRKQLSFSEVVTHFNSILAAQDDDPFLLDMINYGKGGLIKEYNDSFDTLVSAIFVDTNTPVSIIDFANDQYETNLNTIRQGFVGNVIDIFTDLNNDNLFVNIAEEVADITIEQFEQNDALNIQFGDSNTFNPDTGNGIRNWIATLPFVRLGFKQVPYEIRDDKLDVLQLVHHDGHRTQIDVRGNIFNTTIKTLENLTYPNTSETWLTRGLLVNRPSDANTIKKGEFYYATDTAELYRFQVVEIGPTAPSSSFPDGTYWLRDTDNILFVRDETSFMDWVQVTGVPGDIEAAWLLIEFESIIADILLEAETRLYEAAPDLTELAFEIDPTTLSVQEQVEYNNLLAIRFQEFAIALLHAGLITSPFETNYVASNAFTWNYKNVDTSNVFYPTTESLTNMPWSAQYGTINELIFGTQFPHLEPWKLQGYLDKPLFWTDYEWQAARPLTGVNTGTNEFSVYGDFTNVFTVGAVFSIQNSTGNDGSYQVAIGGSTYDGTNTVIPVTVAIPDGTVDGELVSSILTDDYRRWEPLMWDNLADGIVPVGELLSDLTTVSTGAAGEATQYTLFSVNITNGTTSDGYAPDDLLPPFWSPATAGAIDQAVKLQALVRDINNVPNPDGGYVFGDIGPVERLWRNSSRFLYDQQIVAFQMQPMRYMHYTFGVIFREVGHLQTDVRTDKVYSHLDALFHGDIIDDEVIMYEGINQWYTNFNRVGSLDNKVSDFRPLWTEWQPVLSYQFDSFIDPTSLYMISKFFLISDQDFNIRTKMSRGIEDRTVDSLSATTTKIAPRTIFGIDQNGWQFEFSVPAPSARTVSYYGVKSYEFTVDPFTDIFTLVDPMAVLPWETGDIVQFITVGTLPAPLVTDKNYAITKLSDTTFKVAETSALPTLDLTSTGTGTSNVIEVERTFTALSGHVVSTSWKKIALDKTVVNEALMPLSVTGIQNGINFIFGYVGYLEDQGFVFNDSSHREVDPETGRLINWQLEIEKWINFNYEVRSNNAIITQTAIPKFEINPFQDRIWLEHEQGVLADVRQGPLQEVMQPQTVYDQNGKDIADQVQVYRQDKISQIVLDPTATTHLGGMLLSLNGYEHAVMFNDYTVDGNLLFDPFIGLSVKRLRLEFDRGADRIQRPNLGGYFFSPSEQASIDRFAQIRNIEGQAEDFRNYYDTYTVAETMPFIQYSRSLLGYDRSQTLFLEHLDADYKSQFIYWRGLVQNKGSLNSVNAFINSRRFIDARVDEFFAYQTAEFGDAKEKIYPEIKLFTTDVVQNNLKLQFTTTASGNDSLEAGFQEVALDDQTRWYNWPDQVAKLPLGAENLYFDAETTTVIESPTPVTGTLFLLDTPADGITVTFDKYGDSITRYAVPTNGPHTLITLPFTYIQGADNLNVFLDGVLLEEGADYTETSTSSITLNSVSGVLVISIKRGRLVEDVHYTRINAEVVDIPGFADLGTFTIFTLNPAKTKLSPGKVIDYQIGTTISNIAVWDPARGHHFYRPMGNVDLTRATDPARYTVSLDGNTDVDNQWNAQEAGTVWFDTSKAQYVPYYDKLVFPAAEERIYLWGNLADYGDINVYQWTESDVPPSEWDALADIQETDSSIPTSTRASGTAKSVLFSRTRDNDPFTIAIASNATTNALMNGSLFGTIKENDPTGLTFADFKAIVTTYDKTNTPTPKTITVEGATSQTFGELIQELQADLANVTVSLGDNKIVFEGTDNDVRRIEITDGAGVAGYQVVNVGGVTGGTATGLANNSTVYLATLVVDGGATQNIAITGSSAQTYTALLAELNTSRVEITDVTTPAASTFTSTDAGDYWTLNAANNQPTYYVWYDVDGGNIDPTPDGIDFGIEVNVASGDSNSVVATKTAAAIDLVGDFGASSLGAVVTVTNAQAGFATDADDFNAGISVSVTQQGAGIVGATASLDVNSNLRITSSTTSGTSSVLITDFDLFSSLATFVEVEGAVNQNAIFDSLDKNGSPIFSSFSTPANAVDSAVIGPTFLVDNLGVFLQTTGTLPTPLEENTEYFLVEETFAFPGPATNQFLLAETAGGDPIVVEDAGTGTHTMLNGTFPTTFVRETDQRERFYVALEVTSPTFTTTFTNGDAVNVYINGKFTETATVSGTDVTVVAALSAEDFVDIIKPIPEPTDDELAFDPDEEDDGTFITQYKFDFEYTSVTIGGDTKYYFWVTDKTVNSGDELLTIQETALELRDPSSPFMFFQNLLDFRTLTDPNDQTLILKPRYSQSIIRGLVGVVNEDDRYKLRFTKDFTLRNDLNDGPTPLSLKNKHTQWKMFREEQPSTIDRALWDRATEAAAGFYLEDIESGASMPRPLPSLDRQLYDSVFETDTRFGILEDGQALASGAAILDIVLGIIENPNFDTSPIVKEDFLATHSFDTPENIVDAMNFIYNNFPQDIVNNIFFAILLEALAEKHVYPGIIKTSMVALHGIKLLETADIVNDF